MILDLAELGIKGNKILAACHVTKAVNGGSGRSGVNRLMFDVNSFKKSVKEWIRVNTDGTEIDLRDYCDELVPAQQYQANQWLIEQTLSWYKHILERRVEEASGADSEAGEV